MADPSPFNDSNSDTDEDRTPRWVKVFGLIAIVLVLLFVVLHLTGNSPAHSHTPPSSETEPDAQKP